MPQSLTMAPWRLFFVGSLTTFALTACNPPWATRPPTVLTQIQVERQPINQADLVCPPRPLPPEGGTQQDVATYFRELIAWGETCQAKLAEVSEMLRPAVDAPASP